MGESSEDARHEERHRREPGRGGHRKRVAERFGVTARPLERQGIYREIGGRVPWTNVEAVMTAVREADGDIAEVRPPSAVVQAKGETVIVARTVRSGARVESSGSVIVIGDVNAGSELIAEDDIIVLGTLRGCGARRGERQREGDYLGAADSREAASHRQRFSTSGRRREGGVGGRRWRSFMRGKLCCGLGRR